MALRRGLFVPMLHLRAVPAKTRAVTLTFSEIERILGAPLPESAVTHRPWWANQKAPKRDRKLMLGFPRDLRSIQ